MYPVLCLLILSCNHVEALVLPRPCQVVAPLRMSHNQARVESMRSAPSFSVSSTSTQKIFLKAASIGESYLDDDTERPQYNLAQKQSMRNKYNLLSIVYAFVAATLLLMPDRTLTKKLASKLGAAGGFGVAAALARMLAEATNKGRLHSPTYKRLNVGLLGFSFLGLSSVPGEAAFLPTAGSAVILAAVMNATRILGVIVSYSGWSMGVVNPVSVQPSDRNVALLSPKKATEELMSGSFSTFKDLKVQKENKKKSLTYRNFLLLVLVSMVSCLLEGIFCVRYYGSTLGKSMFDISLQWSGVARLFLISTVMFSLKDLADRDRMTTGTIFIKLNLLVASWAALVSVGQSINITGSTGKRIEMLALSLLFLIKGLKAAKFRSDEKGQALLQRPQVPNSDDYG